MKKNNEKELQTEFDINDDNYEMYNRLYYFKKGIIAADDLYGKAISLAVGGSSCVVALGGAVLTFTATSSLNFDATGIALCTATGGFVSFFGSVPLAVNIVNKIEKNHFKKLYPDLNLDVDVDCLEYSLQKYRDLKDLPKDLDKLKEQKLSNSSEELRNLSVEEKIAYYKEQKEFWEKVLVDEKYKQLDKDRGKVKVISRENEGGRRI